MSRSADGRIILIEERKIEDGGVWLRVDITKLKQREASFRLLFDFKQVPMIVCAVDGEHVPAVNDGAIGHYSYCRPEFQKLTMPALQAFDSVAPFVERSFQRGAGGARHADRPCDLFAQPVL